MMPTCRRSIMRHYRLPRQTSVDKMVSGALFPDRELFSERSRCQILWRYPACMQALDDMGQVCSWLHSAETAALHHREQRRSMRCRVLGSDQHPILPADDDHPKRALAIVVVD